MTSLLGAVNCEVECTSESEAHFNLSARKSSELMNICNILVLKAESTQMFI